jgi:hypothetical protein
MQVSAGNALLKFCGASGYNGIPDLQYGSYNCHGFYTGGQTTFISCGSSNNMHGLTSGYGGHAILQSCAISHTTQLGLWAENATISITNGWTFVAGTTGLGAQISNNGTLVNHTGPGVGGYLHIQRADSYGIFVLVNASWILVGYGQAVISSNTTFDVAVANFGMITGQNLIYGSRTFNLALNTIAPPAA